MNLEGHVVLQVLELHEVVVLVVVPRHLVHLDVAALAPLVLVDFGVAVLVLEQKLLGVVEDEVLARRLALVNACSVEDCEMHDGLDARLVEECLMSEYLSW